MEHTTLPAPKADRTSKYDGLTTKQRQLLYESDRYSVTELRSGHWICEHNDAPALFSVARIAPGAVNVISNTGNEHVVSYDAENGRLVCGCKDAERAEASGRPCKHRAVAQAVAGFCRRRRQIEDAQRIAAAVAADDEARIRTERARRAVAGRIERVQTAGRVAA